MRTSFVFAAILLATGCPGHGYVRDYPAPSVADVIAKLNAQRAALSAFTGRAVMDYWIGKDRAKGDVLVMGEPGARVHFAALSPAGDATIAEMVCDGTEFHFVDTQHNCQLAGPCDVASIAQFLRVPLEPDDFVTLALGNTPVLADAKGTVTWDAKTGHELVELVGATGKQSIVLDLRAGKLDVVASTRKTLDDKLVWSIENREFQTVKDDGGVDRRVPTKSRLQSPGDRADLIVEWGDRKLNKRMPASSYVLSIAPGTATCGQSAAPARP